YVAGIDLRLRGGRAHGTHFQPQWRQPGFFAAEWKRAAHPPPLLAHALLENGIVAQSCLQRRDLVCHDRIEHRFDLAAEINSDAWDVGAGFVEIEPACEIGFDTPC